MPADFPEALLDLPIWDRLSLQECEQVACSVSASLPSALLALQVQDLWLNHQREAATALIPDDLVLKTNLLGTKERVRERLRIYRDGGVKTIDVAPDGQTIEERLAVLGQLIELVNEINAETTGPGSPESDFS